MNDNHAWLSRSVANALSRLQGNGFDKASILRLLLNPNNVEKDKSDEHILITWFNDDPTHLDDLIKALANGYSVVPEKTSQTDMSWHRQEMMYDKHISPLVKKIVAHCEKYQIPSIMDFCLSNEDPRANGKAFYATTTLTHFEHTPKRMREITRSFLGKSPEMVIVGIAKDK
jgi:hypothetical protein